ncbi:glycosyltransferase family 4 protein [Catellatospora bangladeshensis]|uniref:Glycosyl transferase n=1 Tax=Catellatospora bangladeshensis TaxID=310355 RepID=A0A8J3J7S7_9ACTN|nr:glycosyltransferase family 4 protein [Catellatospora bangladeshensis]GIF78861.1 glycosyl transferase [Catellatospora bangladeshensis]
MTSGPDAGGPSATVDPVVHVVLPGDIDDPAAPSGGNHYDRRLCDGLSALGWAVREHALPGGWPRPPGTVLAALAQRLDALPGDAVVLVDGLVAAGAGAVLAARADRLRLVVLAHMVFGDEAADLDIEEGRALRAAAAVLTVSRWCRTRLIERYALPPALVHVAVPGVDAAPAAPGSVAGSRLLCVAALAPHKGQDVLADALSRLDDLPWTCVFAGSLDRDPAFVAALRAHPAARRIALLGPLTGPTLDAAYTNADLLVLPSRGESYGMVVTEALARGIPVLACDVAGLPEAVGRAPDGSPPALLVPPGDAAALAAALRSWLTDAALRHRLRRAALGRRDTLIGWGDTARRAAAVLSGVAVTREAT